MKAKYLLLIVALAGMFSSCENETPFDTQSPDDEPLILVPYETKTGTLSYVLADENTPYVDSVIVTPSRYTTVYWYVDDALVCTGTRINMCFSAGTHSLLIEAVTEAGKRTFRTGTITVLGGVDPSMLFDAMAAPVALNWDDKNIRITKETLADVPAGSKIIVHFELAEATYYALRITTPSWGDNPDVDDLVPQKDMAGATSPFSFTYDERCKALVDERDAMCVVGNGLNISKIVFE